MRRPLAEPLGVFVLALLLGGCGAVEPDAGAGEAEPQTTAAESTGSLNVLNSR